MGGEGKGVFVVSCLFLWLQVLVSVVNDYFTVWGSQDGYSGNCLGCNGVVSSCCGLQNYMVVSIVPFCCIFTSLYAGLGLPRSLHVAICKSVDLAIKIVSARN